jgi:hypothetical protein
MFYSCSLYATLILKKAFWIIKLLYIVILKKIVHLCYRTWLNKNYAQANTVYDNL